MSHLVKLATFAVLGGLLSCNRGNLASRASEELVRVADMTAPRAAHSATVLEDGRVLIVGGCTRDSCDAGPGSATSEIFDPRAKRFVQGPMLPRAMVGHTATRLDDGRVLLVGGWSGSHPSSGTLLFDPTKGTLEPGPELATPRGSHTATLLSDGRVLIVGGQGRVGEVRLATSELFDPEANRFMPGPQMSTPRGNHAAARLVDGRVLIGGGLRTSDEVLASAELFDPESGTFVAAGAMSVPRYKHAMVPLPDGGALVVAGSRMRDHEGKEASLERFEPRAKAFVPAGTLRSPRFKLPDAVAVLPDGTVLVAGGSEIPELFDPNNGSATSVESTLEKPWAFMTATPLPSGDVLLAGGYEERRITVSARAWLYTRAR